MSIIYGLFALLDGFVYWIAAAGFRVIFEIANTEFFTNTQINEIANRVYVILGVLMLFKVVISAIQYLVNPDSFDDKEKGFFGLLQKTLITIVLIVIVPVVFEFAMSIQGEVVKAIPAIILGSEASNSADDEQIGRQLSYTVLASFARVREGKNGSIGGYGSNAKIHDIDSFVANINEGVNLISVSGATYDYMIIISTLAGAFLCYVLLSMMLDIAIRTIKIGVIRILAPIPISSYIFGKDKFNKFVKTSLQVYADLFIRMAIVYLIIFVVKSLIENGDLNPFDGVADTGSWLINLITNIAIIFGLLMFAKNAPKFITDLLGLPEITGGDMADMFKPAWQRIGGFAAPAAAIGAYRNAKEYGDKHKFRRAFTAGAHATISRLKDVASGKDFAETYKTSREAAMARTNKNLEYANRYPDARARRRQIRQERWDAYTGVTTGGQKASNTIATANATIDMRKHAWDRANAKSPEHMDRAIRTTTAYDSSGRAIRTYTFTEFDLAYTDIVTNGKAETWAGERAWLRENIQNVKDSASMDYIFQAFAGNPHPDPSDPSREISSGDAETRNVFAEDIRKVLRSGADSETTGKIIMRTATVRNALGEIQYEKNPDGSFKLDSSGKKKAITKEFNLLTLAEKVENHQEITSEEAWALAEILPKMNQVGGEIRVQATKTQTSTPKDS